MGNCVFFFSENMCQSWKLEVFWPRARSERATVPFWCLKGWGTYWKIWKRQCNWILLNLAWSIILIEPDPWKDFGKNRSWKKNLTGIWVHRSQYVVSKWFHPRFFCCDKKSWGMQKSLPLLRFTGWIGIWLLWHPISRNCSLKNFTHKMPA